MMKGVVAATVKRLLLDERETRPESPDRDARRFFRRL